MVPDKLALLLLLLLLITGCGHGCVEIGMCSTWSVRHMGDWGIEFFSILERPFQIFMDDQQSEQLEYSEVKSKAKTWDLILWRTLQCW